MCLGLRHLWQRLRPWGGRVNVRQPTLSSSDSARCKRGVPDLADTGTCSRCLNPTVEGLTLADEVLAKTLRAVGADLLSARQAGLWTPCPGLRPGSQDRLDNWLRTPGEIRTHGLRIRRRPHTAHWGFYLRLWLRSRLL